MVHSIIQDSKGKMWFATNGVYIYDGTTLKNIAEKEGLQSNFVSQIIESKDGILDFDLKGLLNMMEILL
jgi:ligand-binding sensor domain-containing protein